jgi:hypothetical protein
VDNNHQFLYTDLANPKSHLESITVNNDDRIVWVLDPAIPERTFQIDFGPINPFSIFEPVSLRGESYIVSPKVYFPAKYKGDRNLKYSILLGNGWQDDPDVVPVPPDASIESKRTDLATCTISWTSTQHEQIELSGETIEIKITEGKPMVTWQWAENAKPKSPFTLEFEKPVPGCNQKIDSTGRDIILWPGVVPETRFTITATMEDGSNSPPKNGTIEVKSARAQL